MIARSPLEAITNEKKDFKIFIMEAEQLYEKMQQEKNNRYIGWFSFKNKIPGISRYIFHKRCGDLVNQGKLKMNRYSGIITYQILKDDSFGKP